MSIVTRFAPSPTGTLHIGGARTALYSWLVARGQGGRFLLRIEDTDRERSTPEAVRAILDAMAWLNLDHDGEVVYQTARFDRYHALIAKLLDDGLAYHCQCSRERLEALRNTQREHGEKPRYDGHCRPRPGQPARPAGAGSVVRFLTPLAGETVITDTVKGELRLPNSELDDLIIQRSDGSPTYNFCVVVDDRDAGVTHVVRGDDHVNNTPRQIAIWRALGGEPPVYAHLPMILGADGKRLSKRHGAVSVQAYRDAGILPDALLNYLLRLGFAKGDQEIFTRAQMLEDFQLERVQRAAASFDPAKLEWVNAEHIRAADPAALAPELARQLQCLGFAPGEEPPLRQVADVLRERATNLAEMAEKSLFLYREIEVYSEPDAAKHLKPPAGERLGEIRAALAGLVAWTPQAIHAAVHQVADQAGVGLGKVAQPIRVAVTGTAVSPPIDQTLWLLGRERSLARLDAAIAWIGK